METSYYIICLVINILSIIVPHLVITHFPIFKLPTDEILTHALTGCIAFSLMALLAFFFEIDWVLRRGAHEIDLKGTIIVGSVLAVGSGVVAIVRYFTLPSRDPWYESRLKEIKEEKITAKKQKAMEIRESLIKRSKNK